MLLESGNVHVGGLLGPLSTQLHALAGLLSGIVPSIIRSIDPELSIRRRTFGSGGLASTCCAKEAADQNKVLAPKATAIRMTMCAFMFASLLRPDSARVVIGIWLPKRVPR